MSKKPTRCDFCNRRIRLNQHEFNLRDLETGQLVGRYHVRPKCQVAAAKYFVPGVALRATVCHPERCGDDLERCDGSVPEWVA